MSSDEDPPMPAARGWTYWVNPLAELVLDPRNPNPWRPPWRERLEHVDLALLRRTRDARDGPR